MILFLAGLLLPLVVNSSFGGVEQFTTPRLALLAFLAFLSFVTLAAATLKNSFKIGMSGGAAVIFILLLFISNPSPVSNGPLIYFASLTGIFLLAKRFSDQQYVAASLAGILLGGAACSAAGILEFFHLLKIPEVVNWGNRAAGLFSDPNWFGLHAALCLLLAMSGKENDGKVLKIIRMFSIPVCAGALILSGSRSSWTSFALAVPLFAVASLMMKKKTGDATPLKNLAIAVAAIMILASIISGSGAARSAGFSIKDRINSIPLSTSGIPSGRANFINASKTMIKEKLLTGVGSGKFPLEVQRVQGSLARKGELLLPAIARTRHAYNDYLEIAATAGLPALLFYVVFLASIFIYAFPGASPGFAASIACYALFGAFLQSAMNDIPSTAIIWMIAGFAAGAGGENKDSQSPAKYALSICSLAAACMVIYFGCFIPMSYQGAISRAEKLFADEKYADAEHYAKKAIAANSFLAKGHLVLSNIATSSGNMSLAIKEIETALAASPYDAGLHFKAGEMLVAAARPEEAAKHFYESIMLSTGDRSDAFLKYSETLLLTGYVDEALETIKTGVMEYPKKAEMHAQASRAFFEKRELIDALSAAQAAIALDDDCAVCYTRYSQALFAAGKFQAAYNVALKAAELDPDSRYIPRLISALRAKLNNEQ